jgi:hypothetical protein
MRSKHLILFGLLIAYLVVFAHDAIPHHHHSTLAEAERHHQNEHTAHDHGDGHHHDGHGHTPHFVHPADFGTFITSPQLQLTDVVQVQLMLATVVTYINTALVDGDVRPLYFAEPPPDLAAVGIEAFSLRGPPAIIS